MKSRLHLVPAVALAAALFALLPDTPAETAETPQTVSTSEVAPAPSGELQRRAAAIAAHAAEDREVESIETLTREARLEAMAEEEEMAATNRQALFEANISSLHVAADDAEAEGNTARAALMRKRADRLYERMSREEG